MPVTVSDALSGGVTLSLLPAMNTYDIGSQIQLTANFVNSAGAPTNPTTTTLSIKAPDGTISTPAPSNPSTGTFTYLLAAAEPGIYYYRYTGTGAVVAAADGCFTVTNSVLLVPSPYPLGACC